MDLPKYPYKLGLSSQEYEFISEGPKGFIRKVVRFAYISGNLYNLGFGDLLHTGKLNDNVITNNGDHLKVLATIASTVEFFFEQHPNAFIIVLSNTASRMRLYRMGINNIWEEINGKIVLQGFKNGNWEFFDRRTAYSAFLIQKK